MIFLVHVTRDARAHCDFDNVKMCSKWMERKTTSAYLLVDVTTGAECYDMRRLIVTHNKASCASQSSERASAIAERYNIVH